MNEEQPAKKVWLTALKEFPSIFVLEYIAAMKGDPIHFHRLVEPAQ
jgi:hypothetical protein